VVSHDLKGELLLALKQTPPAAAAASTEDLTVMVAAAFMTRTGLEGGGEEGWGGLGGGEAGLGGLGGGGLGLGGLGGRGGGEGGLGGLGGGVGGLGGRGGGLGEGEGGGLGLTQPPALPKFWVQHSSWVANRPEPPGGDSRRAGVGFAACDVQLSPCPHAECLCSWIPFPCLDATVKHYPGRPPLLAPLLMHALRHLGQGGEGRAGITHRSRRWRHRSQSHTT
jgi:hypothetical protein